MIAVIIVCCIVVLLVVVGIFVYMRYRKRYAQGAFNRQFERENARTASTSRLERTNASAHASEDPSDPRSA